jgi:transposase
MTMSGDDDVTMSGPVRRIEVFTGAGRRRTWSDEDKARIVAESYGGLESVCAVARRHGLAQSQLFGWRREARKLVSSQAAVTFAPVVMEADVIAAEPVVSRPRRRRLATGKAGVIELEIDGIAMRVGRGADALTVAAVIRALKATS